MAFQVRRVPHSDVYYVLGQPAVPSAKNAGFTSNAGFVITGEGVVVYDALGTPSLGFRLLQSIRAVTDQPIRFVIAGHYHADHIYGLQAFKDHTDALIIGQQKAYRYIGTDDAALRLAQRQTELAPWVNEHTRVVEPDVVMADEITLQLGATQIDLIYAGPAHSPSDVMMMIEPAGILFTGDIVQNNRIPSTYGPEVNTENWLAGLQTVLEMQPRFIIPGHGTPSTDPAAAIAFTQTYIRYLQDTMRQAVQHWVAFPLAYQNTDWSRYEDLPAFDATNERNAYGVYIDMESTLFK
ncbi:MAG: MBL fold metallo-hydrolase [Salinisphaera sp.]|nr:MBL fold metallo-hydrolase [Salinisphaera sp.]